MNYYYLGELYEHIKRLEKFSEEVAKFYIAEIFLAISSLHARNIIYRDLKPQNILIDHFGHVKLTDFGFAKVLSEDCKKFIYKLNKFRLFQLLEPQNIWRLKS